MNPSETMNGCFSSKSYTWNLGIILFELFYFEILEKRRNNLSINCLKDCLREFNFPFNEKYFIINFNLFLV